MPLFSVTEMQPRDAAEAYLLVRIVAPAVSPERWADFVTTRPAGMPLLVLQTCDGGVFGVASYRIVAHGDGRVMLVDTFVTLEVSAAGRGRRHLTAALEQRAAELGAHALVQPIPGDGPLRNHVALDADTAPIGGWTAHTAADLQPRAAH
ncbi:hypothetical protein ACBY01_06620 [Sphingomonas sp. ac-8]|uniref:hypothetical protein n=1 Tax=Sphingomonas sp. ac-8 TaxID=3242977 RepID=UPI003A7FE680